MATARPAKPVPTISTSVVMSHFLGSGAAAPLAVRGRARPPSAAPAATPIVWRNQRRADEVACLSDYLRHLLEYMAQQLADLTRAPTRHLDEVKQGADPKEVESESASPSSYGRAYGVFAEWRITAVA
jgi:hypothetical protein